MEEVATKLHAFITQTLYDSASKVAETLDQCLYLHNHLPSWRGPAATVNYKPVLSSERVLQHNKQ
jgi:hypothetical protein